MNGNVRTNQGEQARRHTLNNGAIRVVVVKIMERGKIKKWGENGERTA
jgi:hypothetical protein